MAFVRAFEAIEGGQSRLHPTEVVCGYRRVHSDRGWLVQLDTYGSADRQIPGKVSQSLQLDDERARQLVAILRRSFPGLRP